MNTRLLKINAMRQFTEWLDTNYVHLSLFRVYVHMPLSKTYIGLEKREERARALKLQLIERKVMRD